MEVISCTPGCLKGQLKCDGARAETRFRLLAKRTSPFKSVGASVQSTTGSRGVRISGSNAGYTMFRGSVKGTGYPLHSPVSPSPPVRHRVPSRFNWSLPLGGNSPHRDPLVGPQSCCGRFEEELTPWSLPQISLRFLHSVS